MLAFTPSSSPHAFLPQIPSPLSPRSANIHGPTRHTQHHAMNTEKSTFAFDRSSLPANNTTSVVDRSLLSNGSSTTASAPTTKHIPFSQRPIKRAPAPEFKDRRRQAFLRKVQSNREDARYESRGEDIQRLEFMRKRREEFEELARNAPSPSAEEEEEEEGSELPGWDRAMEISSQMVPEEEVEEFVRDEEAEMRALLEFMPEEMETQQSDGSGELWSDGADYDELFSEVLLSQENALPSSQAMGEGGGGGEEMDMS